MKTDTEKHANPSPVPMPAAGEWLKARGVAPRCLPQLPLGWGEGQDQYRLDRYPDPGPDGVVAMLFEWHTADFFEGPEASHLAVGLCGPLPEDPHRGRGLAIGIFSNQGTGPDGQPVETFLGCPDPPGGPAMFIEDFTINEGTRPPREWQLSEGVLMPALTGHQVYQVEVQVSRSAVWAGVWLRTGPSGSNYRWLGETGCRGLPPEPGERINAFIGQGWAPADNRSLILHYTLCHWNTSQPDVLRPLSAMHPTANATP